MKDDHDDAFNDSDAHNDDDDAHDEDGDDDHGGDDDYDDKFDDDDDDGDDDDDEYIRLNTWAFSTKRGGTYLWLVLINVHSSGIATYELI